MTKKLLYQRGNEIFWVEWWNSGDISDQWKRGYRIKVTGCDELGHDYKGTAEVIQGEIEHVFNIERL